MIIFLEPGKDSSRSICSLFIEMQDNHLAVALQ